jgi:hypothetical protein
MAYFGITAVLAACGVILFFRLEGKRLFGWSVWVSTMPVETIPYCIINAVMHNINEDVSWREGMFKQENIILK